LTSTAFALWSSRAVALAAGEAAQAARVLRAGLELWRGPSLADFTYEPFARAAIARAEELHLTAIEERVEADLALGRHGELVGELQALVEQHPLRERLRAELMLALYRCDRQAEALQTFQEYRRALSERLGLDPSPALRQLEASILNRDPLAGAAVERRRADRRHGTLAFPVRRARRSSSTEGGGRRSGAGHARARGRAGRVEPRRCRAALGGRCRFGGGDQPVPWRGHRGRAGSEFAVGDGLQSGGVMGE
jgi:transcriptional activator